MWQAFAFDPAQQHRVLWCCNSNRFWSSYNEVHLLFAFIVTHFYVPSGRQFISNINQKNLLLLKHGYTTQISVLNMLFNRCRIRSKYLQKAEAEVELQQCPGRNKRNCPLVREAEYSFLHFTTMHGNKQTPFNIMEIK